MFAYDVCVIGGCGRVGLPLSLAFADAGKKVLIHDINANALETVRSGKMPFLEKGSASILKEVLHHQLFLTRDAVDCAKARFVVVTIGTPIREDGTPEEKLVQDFISILLTHLIDGQILVLRSTVYPGTVDDCRGITIHSGKRIDITFCPERISEGNSLEELSQLPQIVSGYSQSAVEAVGNLFECLAPSIIELTPREAELAKLFSNAYRYIHFSIANQFYMLAEEHGADFRKIRDAMVCDYPRNKAFPKPGFVGGPCLYKDTAYLAHCFSGFELGIDAIRINQNLPGSIIDALLCHEPLDVQTVGILGMAFKPECDDMRNALSLDLVARLRPACGDLICSDEYVKEYSSITAEELIHRSDVIIIGCAHERYKGLGYGTKKIVRF